MGKEIVRAAIKVNDRLYIGFDHGECFKQIDEHTVATETLVEGFIDNDSIFVDRKQAMTIAKEAGQLRYETNKETLISEDLHLDWLNKQAKQIETLTNTKATELGEAFSIVIKNVADALSQLDASALLELATAYSQSKIELIEQVRTMIDSEDYYCYGDNNINIIINRDKFNEIIDNQIEEIKGE